MRHCVLPVGNWKNDLLTGLVNRCYSLSRGKIKYQELNLFFESEINGALSAVFQLHMFRFDFTFAKKFVHRGLNFI